MGEQRDRVIRAFRFEETDFTPYTIKMFEELRNDLIGFYGSQDILDEIRNHEVSTRVQYPQQELGDGTYRDHFGSVFKRGEHHTVDRLIHPALKEPDLKGFPFPEVTEYCLPAVPEVDAFRTLFLTGVFERCFRLRGTENVLLDITQNRVFFEELLDRLVDINLKEIELAADLPFDAMGVGDDLAYQKALFMKPQDLKEIFKPRYRRIFDRIKACGKMVHVHCDGNVHELIPDWLDIGMDLYNPVQPECNDIAWIKKEYGKELRFLGGVGSQGNLVFGSPQQVQEEIASRITVMGKGGGYILSHCKMLRPETPVKNAAAFIDAVMNQSVRP